MYDIVLVARGCRLLKVEILSLSLSLLPQVKLWNTGTGFCFVTFSDHTAAVSSVVFSPSDKVVLTASLDGTVRAFDLHRCLLTSTMFYSYT